MAEIAGEIDYDNMAVALSELLGNIEAVVDRSIVHQNDFIIFTHKLFGSGTCPLMKLGDVGRGLVECCNNGKLHGRTFLM